MGSRADWAKVLGFDPGKPGRPTSIGNVALAGPPAPAPARKRPKHSLQAFAQVAKPAIRRADRFQSYLDDLARIDEHDATIPARQVIDIVPVPKPRMTQRDGWEKRPAVVRYRAFCDEIRYRGARLPYAYKAIFVLPMPESWPEDFKFQMEGRPVLLKPDASNLIKALEDALVPKDEVLWCIGGTKLWGRTGRIAILKEAADPAALLAQVSSSPA